MGVGTGEVSKGSCLVLVVLRIRFGFGFDESERMDGFFFFVFGGLVSSE